MTSDSWNTWRDEQLDRALATVPALQQYREWIEQNVRGALAIRPVDAGSATSDIAGALGGFGDDPEQYQPVIRLDLAGVRTAIEALPQGHDLPDVPASGVLTLTASPDDAELDPSDPERIRATFDPEARLGDPSEDPKDSVRFTLAPILTLAPEEMAPSRPAKDEVFEDWGELQFLLADRAQGHLFGWPRWNTLAYDPRPGTTWLTLLGLRSDEERNLYFGDGDWLMVFIEPDALATGSFDQMASDEG